QAAQPRLDFAAASAPLEHHRLDGVSALEAARHQVEQGVPRLDVALVERQAEAAGDEERRADLVLPAVEGGVGGEAQREWALAKGDGEPEAVPEAPAVLRAVGDAVRAVAGEAEQRE